MATTSTGTTRLHHALPADGVQQERTADHQRQSRQGYRIGQRSALSTGDVAAIAKLYPVSVTPPPAVPGDGRNQPVGLQIRVDRRMYTATQSFNWVPGSAHTIEALDTAPPTGTKYAFTQWSDAGARVHTVRRFLGADVFLHRNVFGPLHCRRIRRSDGIGRNGQCDGCNGG